MSSVGQAVGMIGGGIVGSFFGATMLGASIGGAIGGYIDPPKGPNTQGPRLSDTTQQTATYGAFIPRAYGGAIGISGNVFWIENNRIREVSKTESQGGKGGGGAKATTYSYFGTFAVGLCECGISESKRLGRIWLAGKLFYDPLSTDLATIISSNEAAQYFTFYSGAATQQPDDRMQAALGVGNVPAYRGLCYLVFKDLPLENYGNSIVGTQVKVEIVSTGADSTHTDIIADFVDYPGEDNIYGCIRFEPSKTVLTTYTRNLFSGNPISLKTQDVHYSGGPVPTGVTPLWAVSGHVTMVFVSQSDQDLIPFYRYDSSITGEVYTVDSSGTVSHSTGIISASIIDDTDWHAAVDSGTLYMARPSRKIFAIGQDGTYISTASTYYVYELGVSENYIFAALYAVLSPTSCTVYRLNRADLSLDATYTQAVSGDYVALDVKSDNLFYSLGSDGKINAWVSGAASDTGLRYLGSDITAKRLEVVNSGLAYVVSTNYSNPLKVYGCYRTFAYTDAQLSDIVSAECLSSNLLTAGDIDVSALSQAVHGFKVSSVASIRSAIEPLQGCWPFDVVPSGYKIKFVPRGGSSVATIDHMELDARASGDAPGVRITHSREMDSQLPRRLEVYYLDKDREYDVGPPGIAERLNTDAINVEQVSLPIVLSAGEGAGKAETLLYLRWLDRHDISFTLPPTYLHLEPADVVTVTAPQATYLLRLTSINYLPDGRLECTAKFENAAIYSPAAVAQPGLSTGASLTVSGESLGVLLDIPCILPTYQNIPGFTASMTGYLDGWGGGVLFVTSDGGQEWKALEGFQSGATIGNVPSAVTTGRTDIVDASSVLTAYLYSGTPSSVTDAQLANGSNLFAYGSNGRWEILQAKTCTQNADDSWSLTHLLRGRNGTEWTIPLHQPFDRLVALDTTSARFIGMNQADLNIAKTYRAVTSGKSIDSASNIAFAYGGVNLKPLSPAYLNGYRSVVDFAWNLWVSPRSRTPNEPFSGMASPIGEASEIYDVEIYSDGTYTTLKRTLVGVTNATAIYTAAQQTADFGAYQNTLYIKWYQLSATVGRGFPLVSSIVRIVKLDGSGYAPAILAKSPLHYFKMEGNTTTITNYGSSGSAATASSSNVVYQQPALLTGATPDYAMKFTAGYMTIPHSSGMNGAYTLVFLMKPTTLPGAENGFLHKGDASSGGNQGHLYSFMPDGKIKVTWFAGGWSSVSTTAAVFSAGVKVWIALRYTGSAVDVLINGALFETLTLGSSFTDNGLDFIVNGSKSSAIYPLSTDNTLDEVAWFSGTLSDSELAAIYNEA